MEWLSVAKELLGCSHDFDQLKGEIKEVQSLSKIVHRSSGFDQHLVEASEDLGAALQRLSVILLPVVSLNRNTEATKAAKRHQLLHDYQQFLPRRARKEWRRLVEERLQDQGIQHSPWRTMPFSSATDHASKRLRTEPSKNC